MKIHDKWYTGAFNRRGKVRQTAQPSETRLERLMGHSKFSAFGSRENDIQTNTLYDLNSQSYNHPFHSLRNVSRTVWIKLSLSNEKKDRVLLANTHVTRTSQPAPLPSLSFCMYGTEITRPPAQKELRRILS